MLSFASRCVRWSLVAGALLGGCATVPASNGAADPSPTERYYAVMDSLARGGLLPTSARAPRIRLHVPAYGLAIGRHVEASFRVDGDAYALVVAVDRDHQVRVLYPESPDEAGYVKGKSTARLERFFAGFGNTIRSAADSRLGNLGRGILLAVASDRPLQLDRLTDGAGNWDESTIVGLLEFSTTSSAPYALGRAVTLTGQEYTVDRANLAGSHLPTTGRAFASYSQCAFGFEPFGIQSYGDGVARLVLYQAVGNMLYASYQYTNQCGDVRYTGPMPVRPVGQPAGPAGQPRLPRPTDSATTTPGTQADEYRRRIVARRSVGEEGLAPMSDRADRFGRGAPRDAAAARVDDNQATRAGGLRFRSAEALRQRDAAADARWASPADGMGRFGGRAAEWPSLRESDPAPRSSRSEARSRAESARPEPSGEAARSAPPKMEPPRAEPSAPPAGRVSRPTTDPAPPGGDR